MYKLSGTQRKPDTTEFSGGHVLLCARQAAGKSAAAWRAGLQTYISFDASVAMSHDPAHTVQPGIVDSGSSSLDECNEPVNSYCRRLAPGLVFCKHRVRCTCPDSCNCSQAAGSSSSRANACAAGSSAAGRYICTAELNVSCQASM